MSHEAKQSEPDIAIGIYTHVPFCASTCDFCAFYQEKPKRQELERYLSGIEKELQQMKCSEPVDTLFWGGGTPGLLPAGDLERLGQLMHEYLDLSRVEEWTIEMAPSTVKPDKIEVLKALGVTRISMGVQSFQESLLEGLGRLHNPRQIYKAYDIIRAADFQNVNLDLMFAIPGQTESMWLDDLDEMMRLAPEHVSTYCLTFEEDTALWVKLSKGDVRRDVENEAELYLKTWDVLESGGYAQYEVSNFSRPGFRCQHNLNTWQMREWCGFGPSASSQYRGERFTNVHSIEEWVTGVESGKLARTECTELDAQTLAVDSLVFGLRMNQGVNLADIRERFPQAALNNLNTLWDNLVEEGMLVRDGANMFLTDSGRLLVDSIGSKILEMAV